MYRREDGKFFRTKELFEAIGLQKSVTEMMMQMKEKYLRKSEEHINEWFKDRIMLLRRQRRAVNERKRQKRSKTK